MKKIRLFTPGPVMVPEDVLLSMARPMEHHRTAFYRDMLADVTDLLRYLFQTEQGDPLVMTGSGTCAGEGAIVSAIHPGKNKALNINNGKFGERWGKVCKAFGLDYVDHQVPWGTALSADELNRLMDADPKIDTVICVHSETSTATLTDIEALAKVTQKRGALLITDCITSCGCMPMKFDEWGIDIAFTGSQKALMLPPGLAFCCVAPKAWKRIDEADCKAFYNDLKAHRKSLRTWDNPYTPANTLVLGLQQVLRGVKQRGIENVWKETRMLADATRAAATAIGMKVFSQSPSDSVTAMWVPDGVDEAALRKTMRGVHGMQIAGGQDDLKGKVIRIGHMGYMDAGDTLAVIGALELTLKGLGHKFTIGAGLKAAQEVFAKTL
ncbi:MAG TPA: alanine--glyoxylate aminotransferase family protein, partial [Phycisphaerae bacterium]|nr:alanine--glyoxylate aminotransferase family protein [Phycisphaerales bacterium]HRX84938.1 alanine--glyoxylate aminotransferase family protein [Phycisphaerae bacterium]